MIRIGTFFGWIFAALMVAGFAGCSDDDATDEAQANRTILVYMAAQNSLSHFASDDFAEMIEGMAEVDANNHLLVYLDTDSDEPPSILHLRRDARRGTVVQETLYTYPQQDDSSVTTERMADVLRRSFSAYPAASYGLILWSHGEGWLPSTRGLRSFGQDGGSSGPVMEIADLEEAIALGTAALTGEGRFDFIYFDACFMQGVEVAYPLQAYADYLIACPLETPGPGAPYGEILQPLFAAGEADAVGMAQRYFQYYAAAYEGTATAAGNWTYGAAISVVQTAALPQLADATRALYAAYADRLAQLDADELEAEVQTFDMHRRYGGIYRHAYYDFGDFVRYLASDSDYQRWKQSLDAAVVYAQSTPTCYSIYYQGFGGALPIRAFSGLSTYVPLADPDYAAWNEAYAALAWTQAVGL